MSVPAAIPAPPLQAARPAFPAPLVRENVHLDDLPPDATFQLWHKSGDRTAIPLQGDTLNVSKVIPQAGDCLLVCFASTEPSKWEQMKRELAVGADLELRTLMIGTGSQSEIGSALWGANGLAGRHGLVGDDRPTLFKPSSSLLTVWRIAHHDRSTRVCNALVLLRNGRLLATWVSGDDGTKPHDWSNILSVVD